MRVPIRILAAALILGPLAGCFSVDGHFGNPIPLTQLHTISVGETTREDIRVRFGPPSAFFQPSLLDLILEGDSDLTAPTAPLLDDVFVYRYIETSIRFTFLPFIFAIAHAEVESQTLIVFFDEDGMVKYHGYRHDHGDPPDE